MEMAALNFDKTKLIYHFYHVQPFTGVSAQGNGCPIAINSCVYSVSGKNEFLCKYEFILYLILKMLLKMNSRKSY